MTDDFVDQEFVQSLAGDSPVPCAWMGFTPWYSAGGWAGFKSKVDSLAYLPCGDGWKDEFQLEP